MKKKQEKKWIGILKKPYLCNQKDTIYKIMVHQTGKNDVYIYFYTSLEAEQSSFDSNPSQSFEETIEDWDNEVSQWIEIQ